ncbi:hypothetical protein FQN50_004806 [Emmonsiellopsis sp. PD_5]|nr:hypothetical protein FQN50_004806 [Emmonsiellopsis sp. PD_5]
MIHPPDLMQGRETIEISNPGSVVPRPRTEHDAALVAFFSSAQAHSLKDDCDSSETKGVNEWSLAICPIRAVIKTDRGRSNWYRHICLVVLNCKRRSGPIR